MHTFVAPRVLLPKYDRPFFPNSRNSGSGPLRPVSSGCGVGCGGGWGVGRRTAGAGRCGGPRRWRRGRPGVAMRGARGGRKMCLTCTFSLLP